MGSGGAARAGAGAEDEPGRYRFKNCGMPSAEAVRSYLSLSCPLLALGPDSLEEDRGRLVVGVLRDQLATEGFGKDGAVHLTNLVNAVSNQTAYSANDLIDTSQPCENLALLLQGGHRYRKLSQIAKGYRSLSSSASCRLSLCS